MQKILGLMRRGIAEFDLIAEDDRIAVGVSGGKDSMVLLEGLYRLQRFIGIRYQLMALTIDLQFGGRPSSYRLLEEYAESRGIPLLIHPTRIGEIVFDERKEDHPCSLCARMRRGALHRLAKEHDCNKVALGHHYDDALETFMMNLFYEGRLGCFAPKSYLSRRDLTLIRPLALVPEAAVRQAAARNALPIFKNPCPVDQKTVRQTTKEFLERLERENPGVKERVYGAMRRAGLNGWGINDGL